MGLKNFPKPVMTDGDYRYAFEMLGEAVGDIMKDVRNADGEASHDEMDYKDIFYHLNSALSQCDGLKVEIRKMIEETLKREQACLESSEK